MKNPQLGVVILLLGLSLLATPISNSLIGRSNPNTILVPRDYATIQAAVAAANPGDTIVVFPNTYDGNITITKSLTLIGTSASTVIINATSAGPGFVVKKTSGVSISQFTIEYPQTFYSAVTIDRSSNVHLTGNIIKNNPMVQGPNGTTIKRSSGVVLRGNTITGNLYGVAIQGGSNNIVQANNITGNQIADIILGSTAGNQIKDNLLRESKSGIEIHASNGNVLQNNQAIANNSFAGIYMIDSYDNLFVRNNIDFNSQGTSSSGIYLQNATTNTFYYNNIRRNSVQMFGVFASDLTLNTWNDSGIVALGNFWSDYTGTDSDADGVGDTNLPWPCPNGGRPCSNSLPKGVDYRPLMSATKPPVLNVTAAGSPLNGCGLPNPLQVSFNSTVQGGSPPYQYSWRFGDGTSGGNMSMIIHGYATRGNLFSRLTVNDTHIPQNSATDIVAVTLFSGRLVMHVYGGVGMQLRNANLSFLSEPSGSQVPGNLTDSQGVASFPCLTAGSYVVQVSSPGFEPAQVTVSIGDALVNLNVTLVKVQNNFLVYAEYAGIAGALAAVLVVGSLLLRRRRRLTKAA